MLFSNGRYFEPQNKHEQSHIDLFAGFEFTQIYTIELHGVNNYF
jgi:hypothetical protein